VMMIAATGSGKSLCYWMALLYVKYGIVSNWGCIVMNFPLDLKYYQDILGLISYFSLLCSYTDMTAVVSHSYCTSISNLYLIKFCALVADLFLMPQPNATKPPLQVCRWRKEWKK
jgi:hypothetical protein